MQQTRWSGSEDDDDVEALKHVKHTPQPGRQKNQFGYGATELAPQRLLLRQTAAEHGRIDFGVCDVLHFDNILGRGVVDSVQWRYVVHLDWLRLFHRRWLLWSVCAVFRVSDDELLLSVLSGDGAVS